MATQDKTGLTEQVKSSLKKAEKAVSKQKRANTRSLVTSFTFSGIATLVAVACLALNIWIADSGGKIRRADFRGDTVLEGLEAPEDH